jgi:Tfp pilus assembly protein FimV
MFAWTVESASHVRPGPYGALQRLSNGHGAQQEEPTMHATNTTCRTTRRPGYRASRHVARSAGNRGPRRGSALAGAGLFLLVALSLIGVGALPTLADRVAVPATSRLVTVDAADTLWSIARANSVTGVATVDMVEAIARLNDIVPGQGLQPGAVVRVPVQAEDAGALALR